MNYPYIHNPVYDRNGRQRLTVIRVRSYRDRTVSICLGARTVRVPYRITDPYNRSYTGTVISPRINQLMRVHQMGFMMANHRGPEGLHYRNLLTPAVVG